MAINDNISRANSTKIDELAKKLNENKNKSDNYYNYFFLILFFCNNW